MSSEVERKLTREFYQNLRYFFQNDKTSWGRVELVEKIKDIYIETLEGSEDAKT